MVHLICSFTVKHDAGELHWVNESSIIDGQSYSTEKGHSGERTISTTLKITFHQPILLSCRSQYSDKKNDSTSSWVQLESNEDILCLIVSVMCCCVLHLGLKQNDVIHVNL